MSHTFLLPPSLCSLTRLPVHAGSRSSSEWTRRSEALQLSNQPAGLLRPDAAWPGQSAALFSPPRLLLPAHSSPSLPCQHCGAGKLATAAGARLPLLYKHSCRHGQSHEHRGAWGRGPALPKQTRRKAGHRVLDS